MNVLTDLVAAGKAAAVNRMKRNDNPYLSTNTMFSAALWDRGWREGNTAAMVPFDCWLSRHHAGLVAAVNARKANAVTRYKPRRRTYAY